MKSILLKSSSLSNTRATKASPLTYDKIDESISDPREWFYSNLRASPPRHTWCPNRTSIIFPQHCAICDALTLVSSLLSWAWEMREV